MRTRTWIAIGFVVLAGCGESPPPPRPPPPSPDFVFMLRPGPTTWFVGSDGGGAGLDYDLARLFAKRRGVSLKIVAADSPSQLVEHLLSGAARIGAGGLSRPAAATDSTRTARAPPIYSAGYYSIEPVVVYNTDIPKPASWRDLDGETVGIVDGGGLELSLERIRQDHPAVTWSVVPLANDETLIQQIADGTLNYAVVASTEASAARNIYLDVDTAFVAGPQQELSWVFPPGETRLRDDVDRFFSAIKRDGTLQRLIDRYFGFRRRVVRPDASAFHDSVRDVLPQFGTAFRRGQEETGIDWRLLAAIAYQESHWDPLATSETNVRGMMMLTEETARRLQVTDRLDARQSILGGARYVAELKRTLPDRIVEPDRTWIALAAFNVGVAHLEDARQLAIRRKLDPDSWPDLKKTLPLLARPDLADGFKYGSARGGQAVVFVETVRAYYDVLLRLEKPSETLRLHAEQRELAKSAAK